MAGSVIQLGSGETKKVEDLQTEDFIKSAAYSSDLSLEHSKLTRLEQSQSTGSVTLSFSQPQDVDGVAVVSAEKDHPFFVSGHGWSSCSPTSSYNRYWVHYAINPFIITRPKVYRFGFRDKKK